jgi:uncharacterized protein YndB with AHSA1/START domain
MTTATKTASAFRMECAVTINIKASPERIWSLLTNADDFPRWNSTVTSIKGPIAQGTKLELRVPLAPKRVFKPKVTELDASAHRMVWSDGAAPMFKGVRTYTLTKRDDNTTDFAMVEVFRGIMLPMIKGSLPDFAPAFATYADDLKRAAEQP